MDRVRQRVVRSAFVLLRIAASSRNDEGPASFGIGVNQCLKVEYLSEEIGSEHVCGRAGGPETTVSHGQNVCGVAGREVEIMQHRDEGPPLLIEMCTQVEHFELMRDVEVRGRFVEEHDGRLLGQRHGDPRALALTTREFSERSGPQRGHSH